MSKKIKEQVQKKKRKERKHKFSFIDFILILAFVALVVGCVYIFSPDFHFDWFDTRKETKIQYTVEIQGVDEEFIKKIQENDVVLDSVTKSTLGTVIAVDYSTKHTALDYSVTATGEKEGILVEYPDKYNVVVTVWANAKYKNGEGYTVNNCRVAVGELLALKFPNYVCEGFCIGIDTDLQK